VLPQLHRGHRDHRVAVVGRCHDHRVDVLLLLEHHPVVRVADRLRAVVENLRPLQAELRRGALVHVAQRDDVRLLGGGARVARAHPVGVAHRRHVHAVARRLVPRAAEDVARDDHHSGSGSHASEQRAARDEGGFFFQIVHVVLSDE
jgi:hypothetical protein